MLGRSVLSISALAGLALSCRGSSPVTAPRSNDPLAVDSPDHLSPQQKRLAALTPVATSAGDAKLDSALDAFQARTKARRGFIAVDKPIYQPGETIWFRLFDLASADLSVTEKDVATIKLVSPRGSTVLEKKVLVTSGGAVNEFDLSGGLPGGEYVLRAETIGKTVVERRVIVASYEAPRIKKKLEFVRKAYGPGDTVTATLALHRATGEPLASRAASGTISLDGADLPKVPIKTDAAGNAIVRFKLPAQIAKGDGLLTVLVDDGGVTESVQKRIPITITDMRFSLYPEGGDLVAGLPSRVYFQAKNLLDKPADVEGRVLDDRGRVVALLRSYHDGLGRFELQPEPGRSYKVELTKPSGIAKTFAVPSAKEHGCTLQALDDHDTARADLRVAVWCTKSQEIVVSASLREKRVATATASIAGGAASVIALPMPAASQGAVRVTVFDRALAPQAERLVYRNHDADLDIKITADKATYHPRDGVSLAIETKTPDGKPVQAELALSVVDDTVLSFADDKQATLLARLYLEAEMPGQKIEEPNFYFDRKVDQGPIKKDRSAALDLVLGTHGWRRFDWKPVFAAPPKPPIEESWEFTGDPLAKHPRKKLAKKLKAAEPEALPVEEEEPVVAKAGKAAPAKGDALKAEPPKRGDGAKGEKIVVAGRAERRPVAAGPAPREVPPMAAPPPPEPMQKQARRMEPKDDAADEEEDARPGMAMDMDMEAGGEAAEIMDAPRNRNRGGFDVGVEQQRKNRIQIRGRGENAEEVAEDPYCCTVAERQFPVPSYEGRYDGPRVDFRETLLWAPRVVTDKTGKATVTFPLSDAVTSFKVAAEGIGGGKLGRGEAEVQSKKPVSLAVKLPLEVSAGDTIRLPVIVANETAEPYAAQLSATFGKAFAVKSGALAPTLQLAPNERKSMFYDLTVVGDGATKDDGKIAIAVSAANLRDEVERTITVVPIGFPQEVSISGTLAKTVRHEILVSDVLPDTMSGTVSLYPTALATMVKGTEAMIAEPGGCFEQASSTNYPNIMILGYLDEVDAAEPALVTRTQGLLDKGYKLLTGYETKTKGYEWFGGDPGHEALTAYGLMQFKDMKKVYGSVDQSMVDRTRGWLKSRRDGNGGFLASKQALDTFGRASPEVTNAYITYALTEAGEKDIGEELAAQRAVSAQTKDTYVMALATHSLVNAEKGASTTKTAVGKLVGMQAADGSFPGADHSITRSGGEALGIETTALAALALMKNGGHTPEVRKAVEWMDKHRSGFGGYGSTQSTVLALKAMAAYAKESRRTEAAGVVTLTINGKQVKRVPFEKGHQGAIELPIAAFLKPGKNVIDIALDSPSPLPYSGVITWGSKVPATSPATKVRLATQLAKSQLKLGEGVRMNVKVTNATDGGLPMTLARVGMPGGLTFQTWQLKELRDKGVIDFYETRPREVILYFRALAPKAVKDIPLELMSTVPGTFTAPASRAYLYYTAEHKHWVDPSIVTVMP